MPEVRARESGRPEGEGAELSRGQYPNSGYTAEARENGTDLRSFKEHNQTVLVTFWRMRKGGEEKGSGTDPVSTLTVGQWVSVLVTVGRRTSVSVPTGVLGSRWPLLMACSSLLTCL